MAQRPHILVIDPAVKTAEVDCFNQIALYSPLPVTYHLPGLYGMATLEAETEGIAGIIILGSSSSVYDRFHWQRNLEDWLMPWLEKKTPTIGFCYGHQMLSHIFGGSIGYAFKDQRKLQGFRRVTFLPNPLWGDQKIDGMLFASHREVVNQPPNSMQTIATSAEVINDGLIHKTLPIWSFQTHPESTLAFLKNIGSDETPDQKQFEFGHGLVKNFLNYVSKNHK